MQLLAELIHKFSDDAKIALPVAELFDDDDKITQLVAELIHMFSDDTTNAQPVA